MVYHDGRILCRLPWQWHAHDKLKESLLCHGEAMDKMASDRSMLNSRKVTELACFADIDHYIPFCRPGLIHTIISFIVMIGIIICSPKQDWQRNCETGIARLRVVLIELEDPHHHSSLGHFLAKLFEFLTLA